MKFSAQISRISFAGYIRAATANRLSMSDLADVVRDDPAGAGLAALLPVLFLLAAIVWWGEVETPAPHEDHADVAAIEEPPAAWLASAEDDDVLRVPGRTVHYWGRPDVSYGIYASRHSEPFRYLAIHYTAPRPLLNLVRYQHNGDDQRGGSFGYHVYIGKRGHILQGAPLSSRTNHLKGPDHRARTGVLPRASSSNTISISMVGACVEKHPGAALTRCVREEVTPEQLDAGLAVARSMMRQFGIPCDHVAGHGDLQRDRAKFEGSTLTEAIKNECGNLFASMQ